MRQNTFSKLTAFPQTLQLDLGGIENIKNGSRRKERRRKGTESAQEYLSAVLIDFGTN